MSFDFDISSNGFLPKKCKKNFPEPMKQYQQLVDNMHNVTDFRSFTDSVFKDENTEILSKEDDFSKFSLEENKFIYSAMAIIINKYIWCNGVGDYAKSIPYFLGMPYYNVCKNIGILPVLTHSAVDLFNWSFVNTNKDWDYEPTNEEKKEKKCKIAFKNVMVNYSLSDTIDEHWFYLIMIAIEFIGAKMINTINCINISIEKKNINHLEFLLNDLSKQIEKSTDTVKKMYEHCNPDIFFNLIRIYLQGYDTKYFPDGLKVEDSDITILNYRGGSAAQSSLIQCLDVLLHSDEIGCEFSKKFLSEMLEYMPKKHKNYIMHLKKVKEELNLHDYVIETNDKKLIESYNKSLQQLKLFRGAHFQLVVDYVFQFTGIHAKGTGGTKAKDFLSDLIVSTKKQTVIKKENLIQFESLNWLWHLEWLWQWKIENISLIITIIIIMLYASYLFFYFI